MSEYDSEKALLERVAALGKKPPESSQDAPQSILTVASKAGPPPPPKRSISPPPDSTGSFRIEGPGFKLGLGEKVWRYALAVLFPALAGAGAGAATSGVKAPEIPPGVLSCPVDLEALRVRASRLESKVDRLDGNDDDKRSKITRLERRDEQIIDDLETIRQRLPKVIGVRPRPED